MTTRIEYNDVAVKAYAGLHKLIELRNHIQQHQLIVSGLTVKENTKLLDSISEIIAKQYEVLNQLELVEESLVTS